MFSIFGPPLLIFGYQFSQIKVIYLVPNSLRHDISIGVRVELVIEGGSGEDHGELAAVVGVVVPRVVLCIPGMVPARKSHKPVPVLSPHSVK